MGALLDRTGRGLLDIEDGFAAPPSAEGLDYCREVLRRAEGKHEPEEVEECGRDLIAYVLTYQDQGWSVEAAVQAWAEEWMLDE